MTITHDTTGICERIRQLRVETAGARGKAAFARQIEISPSTYDYYENTRVPPADALVRIADVTHVDLRWLLTGREGEAAIPAGHPAVVRAAQLLASHPQYAGALAAFVDLLAETGATFPVAAGESADVDASSASLVAAEIAAAPAAQLGRPPIRSAGATALVAGVVDAEPPAVAVASAADPAAQRQGWIPILGRSAAGVPQFWAGTGSDDGGATTLADLVRSLAPRDARRVAEAEATGELAGEAARNVQVVLLDAPEAPGTAEFVIAEHIVMRHRVLFAVRIDGESMAPEIRHGDVVVLSPDVPAEGGLAAVVQLADQIGVTCKLIRFDDDTVHLIPVNESFPPTRHARSDLLWALKVIARIRPVS